MQKLKLAVLSVLSASAFITAADARSSHSAAHHATTHHTVAHHNVHNTAFHVPARRGHSHGYTRTAMGHHYGHVIQCVAYAKSASDVVLRGNARDWWHNAAGVYDRGHAPESGSVLNFRATRRMPLGHVAVVRNVIDNRTITIDQSHWAQAGVSRNVNVIDVSPNNDWSAVRVSLNSRSGTYGSIYPTYGFIYGHHNTNTQAPDLRQQVMTAWAKRDIGTQVAQAPAVVPPSQGGEHITFNGE